MYLRFETNIYFKGSDCKKGIFAALGDLKRRNVMTLGDFIFYRRTAEWFNENINFPRCYLQPFVGGVQFNSVSWFKFMLGPHIDGALSVAKLLKKYDIGVNTLIASKPGRVIYEDELQIVVMLDNKKLNTYMP